MKYVYVTEVEQNFNRATLSGQKKVLDIFDSYEKARDFIIEKANFVVKDREDDLYIEKDGEHEGYLCSYVVMDKVERTYLQWDPDDDYVKYIFYAYRKELK